MRVFRSILAAREAMIAEMGELAERTVLAEAEEACQWLPHTRRMRLVASKRYQRTVADLPLGGTDVVLRIRAREFFCRVPSCARRIFTERIGQFEERVRPVPEAAVEHGAELLEQVKRR